MSSFLIKSSPIWLMPLLLNSAFAAALTDGSMGARQNLSGKFVIPQSLGTTRGANLFHSFASFSVDPGEQARFTSNATISNIIARVTGGSSTQIQGLLHVSGEAGSAPNFYFINPAGVVFGATAQIDVPGSFYVSTANYLRFKEGEFHADLTKSSSLSVAAPEAFGFLAKQNGSIQFEPGAQLTLTQAPQVHLSAATIQFNQASLQAPAAQISLQTSTQADELRAGQFGQQQSGQITLRGGAQLNSSSQHSQAAGNILLQTGALNLDGAIRDQAGQVMQQAETTILANARADAGRSGDIQIKAEQVQLLNSARISSSSFNTADAGEISVQGQTLTIDGAGALSGVFSQANQTGKLSGKAGQIEIKLEKELKLLNGAQVSASTFSDTAAGGVKVQAATIVLDGSEARGPDTGILSISYGGKGDAGTIDVKAKDLLSIRASAQISSATQGQGNAAAVLIETTKLEIDGDGISTGINSISSGAGKAGNLTVKVNGDALIQSYGGISSSSFATGAAGNIHFQAKNLEIRGKGEGGIYSDSGDFRTSASFAGGDAGTINLNISDKVTLSDGGKISSTTYTRGRSGNIQVQAGQVALQGSSAGIFAETIGQGDAGNIKLDVQNGIEIRQGAQISSSTRFAGKGGMLTLSAQNLTLSGAGSAILSEASSGAQQDAGEIKIQLQNQLQVLDGAQISSATNSYHKAAAGAVTVKAGQILLDGKSSKSAEDRLSTTGIFSSANTQDADLYSAGNGGAINLEAERLSLQNQAVIATDTNARGSAGKVQIKVQDLNLNQSQIRSEAGPESAGQVGSLDLQVSQQLNLQHSKLSINNLATSGKDLSLSQLNLQAGRIISQQSEISAAAKAEHAASDLLIKFDKSWLNQNSKINTSAVDGNGGKITIQGHGALVLQQSQITTSVGGNKQGNGGDIAVSTPVLVMADAMILANTSAAAASGGKIQMQVPTLLAQAQRLKLGGQLHRDPDQPVFGNLIQAAAPDGINGEISLASSPVDLNSSLLRLDLKLPNLAEIYSDLCRVGTGSSFSLLGRGSAPASSLGWISLPQP